MARYALKLVKGGQWPGGTVFITITVMAVGIGDKAAVRAWFKDREKLKKAVEAATKGKAVKGTLNALKKTSLNVER